MAKRRASLKGKGVDILLGGPVEDEPEAAAPVEPAADEPAAGPEEADSTKAAAPAPMHMTPSNLVTPNPFAEGMAASGTPNPFAETSTAQPASEDETLSAAAPAETPIESLVAETPAAEVALGQPPAPIATTLPTEDNAWLADAPLPIPGTESAPVSDTALPTSVPPPADQSLLPQKSFKIGGLFMSMPSIPNPETFEPQTELTQSELSVFKVSKSKPVVSEEEVLRRIGPERIQQLSKRIDELYTQVTSGTISDVKQASAALLYLRQARDKELEDQRQYDEAEYLVNVAQYIVTRAGNVRQWSYTYGIVMLIYGLIWLVVFTAGLVLDEPLLNFFRTFSTVPSAATAMADVFAPYNTVLWGGIGGVLGLLYSLFKHVAVRQDFDRQFVLWYIIQPFMGMLMGAIVHLFFVAGVFQLVGATSDAFDAIGALLAIAAAFRQHYVYAWLESVLKAFEPGKSKEKEAEGPESLPVGPVSPTPAPQPESQPAEPAGVG